MLLYNVQGTEVSRVFDVNGNVVETTYSINQEEDNSGNETVADVDLVVMSYNIQRWKGINANATIVDKIFNKYNPNIVGFQEYDTSKTMDSESLQLFLGRYWDHLEVGGTQIANYTKAVVSDYELTEATTVYYTSFSESRSYQKMYINIGNKRIAVLNTHLDYTTSTSATSYKVKQAKELFDAVVNDEYFIIIGDLNTICTSTSDADYINMIKQFEDAGYNCANCTDKFGFFNTWTGGTDTSGTWEQTDNIITSANITINNVVVDTTKLDENTGLTIDHLPLVAYITVK